MVASSTFSKASSLSSKPRVLGVGHESLAGFQHRVATGSLGRGPTPSPYYLGITTTWADRSPLSVEGIAHWMPCIPCGPCAWMSGWSLPPFDSSHLQLRWMWRTSVQTVRMKSTSQMPTCDRTWKPWRTQQTWAVSGVEAIWCEKNQWYFYTP